VAQQKFDLKSVLSILKKSEIVSMIEIITAVTAIGVQSRNFSHERGFVPPAGSQNK
jgi:hypothetical protein